MHATEITREMLPFFQILAHSDERGWYVFTQEPFATKEEAEKHRQTIIAELQGEYEAIDRNLRVVHYDHWDWQADLVVSVLKDADATRRALMILRPETLLDVLKG
jgi:hypothetical protein